MSASAALVDSYHEKGFAIVRGVIDSGLIAEADQHVRWLARKYPELRPEHYHHPLMRDDAFWVRLVTDPRLIDIAEVVLGPDIACFTAHYICKPPYDGQAVLWHQDGSYWKLAPMHALTVWLAVDHSNPENGCLRMIPGSHRSELHRPEICTNRPNMLYSAINEDVVQEWIDSAGVVDVVLQPGDVSIHHPRIIHSSEPNQSAQRRCGLDMGFIRTSTRVSNQDLYLHPLLVRGEAIPGINDYRSWPLYSADRSIPFRGHEQWNAMVRQPKADSDAERPPEEPPIEITRRMMARLRSGTVKE